MQYKLEGEKIIRINLYSVLIESIGYDPQCALLEIRLQRGGRVEKYDNVPEDVWYDFRESSHPDVFYRRCICGHYREMAEEPVDLEI